MKSFRAAMVAMIAIGAICTITLQIYCAADGVDLFTTSSVWFVVWALFPYALVTLSSFNLTSRVARFIALLHACVITVGGVAVYADAIFVHPDAQGALVFLFVPLWQALASLVILSLAWVAEFRHRKSADT